MRTALVLFFILGCAFLNAATLLNESFSGTSLPAGWTFQGPQVGAWSISPTFVAGGAANEVRLNYTPSGYGTYRLISPPIDTRKVHDMTLSFRHMFDHYDTQEFATIAVELAHDPESFDWELWYVAPTGDIAASLVTVPISFDLGMSETTYISFVFRGNNWNINSWYIDNIVLTYDNTLGSGTWETGNHYPVGDVIIPNGHTLTLNAGTSLIFDSNKELTVDGRLLANGTASQPVVFTRNSSISSWGGIKLFTVNPANDSTLINHAIIQYCYGAGIQIYNSHKLRISNSDIRYNDSPFEGGGINSYDSSFIVENCDIHGNNAPTIGAAIYVYSGIPVIRNNRIYENYNTGNNGSTLYLYQCNVSGIYNNQISVNYPNSGGYAVKALYCNGTFKRNLINNNQTGGFYIYSGISTSMTVLNCDIVYNGGTGYFNYSNTTTLKNTIISGNDGYGIHNYQNWDHINISYCCFNGNAGGSFLNVIQSDFSNCIYSSPQFINPTSGSGISDWSFDNNWQQGDLSPCIDAADPASPFNPDGSREDIGMYYRLLKPVIITAADFSPDQGHQLDLVWTRNDKDCVYDPDAFYEIWRESTSRTDNAVYIDNPLQITPELINRGREILWRDCERTWYYLNIRVPARMNPTYGMIVPTLIDSSSMGTHAMLYKVSFCNRTYFWDSVPVSGYTVDNIPPYAPSRLDIAKTGTNRFNLSWDEVTEGGWEGNSYPEVNLITYKVYAGDTPDFEISPSAYLMSTANHYAVLNNQTTDRRFYKIIATDSE